MSLILLRADNQSKLLNSLADLERHAGLKINGKPRLLENEYADKLAESIINRKIRKKSRVSVVIRVQESDTHSIMQVKKIHPPAHIIVVSSEYSEFSELKDKMRDAPTLKGYYSHKDKPSKK
ncbi:DUF356 domain-containing protein [Methanobacterium alcaliphilum]|uniref:DUF356 domain-containing protein n=1 Tax=Methanobacterium alcaliphilum TaxID=392018 RepID=UPI00200AD8EA|nr:DUF356 domain-containing protein [Methanobacterium alcaliphilum]MCK9152124.1 DUF356 domain-containing protein [Methanobacterium alcaliphilum]